MVAIGRERLDQCAPGGRTGDQIFFGANDHMAGASSSPGAYSYGWAVLHLHRWLHLLVLRANNASTLDRLECLTSQLDGAGCVRGRPYWHAVVRRDLGPHR